MDKRRDYIRHHERLLDNRLAKVGELERQLCVIAEDVARFSATLEAEPTCFNDIDTAAPPPHLLVCAFTRRPLCFASGKP